MFVLLITHNSVTHNLSLKSEAIELLRYADTPIPRYPDTLEFNPG
ncbi:MAG: hypothetical protein RRA15_04035 [bacterium]|nr:hypothetical protein [bacterium]